MCRSIAVIFNNTKNQDIAHVKQFKKRDLAH